MRATSTACEENQAFCLPSKIVTVDLEDHGISHTVKVPENELFRVKNIFHDNEYSTLRVRRHQGPLKIFDIGANIGLYAVYAKFIDPQSVIHCFEPFEGALTLLKSNVKGLCGINLHPYGLFNNEQKASMNIHRFNSGENSIKLNNQYYDESTSVMLKNAGSEFDKSGVDYLDILKIDTEGCEVEILESIGDRLSRIDYILVEYHSEAGRRHIDRILSEFYVFASKSGSIGNGTVKYINANLLGKHFN
jgi:FkbM family methyltransferase